MPTRPRWRTDSFASPVLRRAGKHQRSRLPTLPPSLYVVKDLLGHSSITVAERYAHLSPDHGREAVQKLLPL